MLEVFDEFNITATWAVVGILFHEREEAAQAYPKDWEGKYPAFEELYKNKHPLLHGADVIDTLLAKGAKHEIAFHGYVHRIFEERLMSREEACAEIQAWRRAAQRQNIRPYTVIFPRNKIGHLDLFKQHDFVCYRGEERMPKLYLFPFWGKPFRRFYYYLAAFSTPPVYELERERSGLVNLPASRWLFGFNRHVERALDALNLHTLRLRKMADGIHQAAREKKIIHLWAHPHEFQTPKDIEKLRYLLHHVAAEVEAGRMQSVGMAELARKALMPQPASMAHDDETKKLLSTC